MPGQMGQQMGEEAEPSLICSMKNPEPDRAQSGEARGRQDAKHSKKTLQAKADILTLRHNLGDL